MEKQASMAKPLLALTHVSAHIPDQTTRVKNALGSKCVLKTGRKIDILFHFLYQIDL